MQNHVEIIATFMKNGYFNDYVGIAAYMSAHISGFIHLLAAAIIFYIFTTMITLFILCVTVLFIKVRQNF